ncbi:unnamed protein product, partial [Medioppia subpectinata]
MIKGVLLECERVAIQVAIGAGALIRSARSAGRLEISAKESAVDLVTETDKQVERYVFDSIRQHFPNHRFIGEESRSEGTGTEPRGLTSDPTWIIDPIDGTMNFVHNNPNTCVSIALAVGGQPVVGVIYGPFLDKLYTARLGAGARCNGQPITARTNCRKLSDAMLITEMGNHQEPDQRRAVMANIEAIIWRSHGFRCMGSTALQLCCLAEGAADGFWHFGIHVWDYAAGGLILTEAGGVVLDTQGGPIDWCRRRVLAASSPELGQELSAALIEHLESKAMITNNVSIIEFDYRYGSYSTFESGTQRLMIITKTEQSFQKVSKKNMLPYNAGKCTGMRAQLIRINVAAFDGTASSTTLLSIVYTTINELATNESDLFGAIDTLKNLETLNIKKTGVTTLPTMSLSGLRNLQKIMFWNNPLKTIFADAIHNLPSLTKLTFKDSPIERVSEHPFTIGRNTTDQSLEIEFDPLLNDSFDSSTFASIGCPTTIRLLKGSMKYMNKCERVAIEVAIGAGALMRSARSGGRLVVSTKANNTDLVTETDKQVERYVFDSIRRHFPDHRFIGEESRYEGN